MQTGNPRFLLVEQSSPRTQLLKQFDSFKDGGHRSIAALKSAKARESEQPVFPVSSIGRTSFCIDLGQNCFLFSLKLAFAVCCSGVQGSLDCRQKLAEA